MSELYDKKLEKNYGKVQKTELKYLDKKDKVLSSYDKKLKTIATNLRKEAKLQKDKEKSIKFETKTSMQQLKEQQKQKTVTLNNQNKNAKKKLKDDLDVIERVYKEQYSALTEEKKITGTTNTAEKREDAKKHKKVQTSFAGKEKRAVKRFEGMKTKERAAIKERKKQADEKIKTLNAERDEQVKELSDASQAEVTSLYEVIAFRRDKTDDIIKECEEKHKEIIDNIEKEEEGATLTYQVKLQKNEQAREEKIARRSKFLQKADEQGDLKNVKLQKREIKQLEAVSERELKMIKSDYEKLIKEIELKRTFEERRYLEEIAEKEREFAQFKQEQLWRIELNQIENSETITDIKLETEKKLYAETLILQQIDIDFEMEVGRLEKEKQVAINDLTDLALKADYQYDKDRDTKALVFEMKIAQLEKDIKIAQYQKEMKKNEKQALFDIQAVEYEVGLQLLKEDLDYQTIEMTEKEFIQMHKNDFEKQSSIRDEYQSGIKELKEARVQRAQEQLEFEELEIENRFKVKAKFLEDQKDSIDKDYKLLVSRIENNYKQEENFYKEAIKQIERQEKAILNKQIGSEAKEMKKLEEELAEIEAAEGEQDTAAITSKLQQLIDVVTVATEETQKIVDTKSQIMKDNISIVQTKLQQEKDDAKTLFDREIRNVKYALELLDQNKVAELTEAKARYTKTLNNYHGLENDVATKVANQKEEHLQFMNRREDYENSILRTAKDAYDKAVAFLEEAMARKISSIKDGLKTENGVLESLIKEEQESYQALQKESVHKKAIIHNTAEAKLLERNRAHEKRIEEVDADYKKIVQKRDKEMKQKDQEFKALMAQVEKSIQVEKKKYEDDRKKAQKAYEVELKKSISSINKNLDLESRLV